MARYAGAVFSKYSENISAAKFLALEIFAWWLRELRALLPDTVARRLFGTGVGAIVFAKGDALYVSIAEGVEPQLLTEKGQSADGALLARLQQQEGLAFLIVEDAVLRRVVSMPSAAASKARAAIGFMLDRLTPFPVEEIYCAVRVHEIDRSRKLVRAELIAVPKRLVDPHVTWLRNQGAPVSKVFLRGDGTRPEVELDVPNAHGRVSNSWLGGAWKPVMVAGLLILALGPVGIAVALQMRAAALAEQADALAVRVREAPDLHKQIETLTAQLRTFSMRMKAPSASMALERLAMLTPDDSWMFSIEFGDKGLTTQGLSRDIPNLVSRLNAAPFTTPELIGSIVNAQSEGKDRFNMHVPFGDATP